MKSKVLSISQSKEWICKLGKVFHSSGWVAACDGNISFKVKGQIWITPTQTSKQNLKPKNLINISSSDKSKASSELLIHQAIYESAPNAKWIGHAHPPYSIAYSIAHPDKSYLPWESLSELILSCGIIPIIPYQRPGSIDLAKAIKQHLSASRILLLAHHGVFVWGETPEEIIRGMERIEHAAKILAIAEAQGSIQPLNNTELEYLKNLRAKLGNSIL